MLAQETAAPPEVHGHLRTIDGVDVLFLHGDLEQRGFAEGYLMGRELVALFRSFALSDRVVPMPKLWDLLVRPRVHGAVVVPDHVRERAAAIVRGVAARDPALLHVPELGRDLKAEDLVASATLPDFIGLLCSSFVAWGDRIAGTGPIVGRNLDYFSTPELLRKTMLIVHAPRGDRAGWVSVGWPGVSGCLTGFSERGVSVAIHDVPAKAVKGSKITPRPVALQELIERLAPCADPAEAAARILREHTFGMGGNAMVGWHFAKGSGAVVGGAVFELHPAEDAAGGVTVRGPAGGASWVTCTNHHRARVEPGSCWRYEALFDAIADIGTQQPKAPAVLDFASAWQMIGRSQVDGTLYQTVADLSAGTVGVRLRRAPRVDEWSVVERIDVRALIAEASRGAPAAEEGTPAGANGGKQAATGAR